MARMTSMQLQSAVADAVAEIMVDGGADAVTVAAVCDRIPLNESRLYRAYRSKRELMAGVYEEGYVRVERVCHRAPVRGVSGVDAAVALTYDLFDQARRDPVVAALYASQLFPVADENVREPVYVLWRTVISRMLLGERDRDCDPMIADTDLRRVVEIIEVWVSVLAGACASRWGSREANAAYRRLHLMLRATVPALCSAQRDKAHMLEYLDRLRDHALAHV